MKAGQFITWYDLFVFIDDGTLSPWHYDPVEAAMLDLAKTFPKGFAALIILPGNAHAPSEASRKRVKELRERINPFLTCYAYLVEGHGLNSASVITALISMNSFSRPIPVYAETKMDDA